MHIILKPLINNQIYKDFYNKNDYIEIKSELDWENFLFQNKKRKIIILVKILNTKELIKILKVLKIY